MNAFLEFFMNFETHRTVKAFYLSSAFWFAVGTFAGLIDANRAERAPAPLSALSVGLKCGGSDGFSGISANPGIGYTSDLLSALGGTTLLAEFLPRRGWVNWPLVFPTNSDEPGIGGS